MENNETLNCALCCDNKIDDLKHVLIECPWTKDKTHIIFTKLDPDKVWFGNICSTKLLFGVYDKSINNIILILKQYLLSVRSGKCTFSLKTSKEKLILEFSVIKMFYSEPFRILMADSFFSCN